MRIEGLITEAPLHLAELSEEAFLPAAPELNDIPAVVSGVEPATSECVVPVPASLETTVDPQSRELQIGAAIPTAPETGVEEDPASEACAARAITDWEELFAQRERIKAEREKRSRSKRRASSHSCAQLSFDWA